jgi:multiple sugar transport system ATP-binding protein
MAVVETRGLEKHFGDVRAVTGVDITIHEGEFLVLLGPSGCGKTTTMRLIAGLEKPTHGDILIDGQKVNDLPPRARKVAMVFQSYALYPHMTVYNNIAFPLKAEKLHRGAIHTKVEWAAGMFNISHLLERRPRQLSGGERQRVALARAVVREPNVFLLDEPLSNLDAKLRAMARDELKQYQRQLGVTTLYVTHDQVEAMGMGDRVAVMSGGKIRQLGTPQELYRSPADTYVATFLGSPPMNLVEKDTCILGFHPEHILPTEIHIHAHDPIHFAFDVTRVEYLGSERFLYGVVDGETQPTRIVAALPSLVTLAIEAGRRYDFVVDRHDLSFFDKTTEQRIAPVTFSHDPSRVGS